MKTALQVSTSLFILHANFQPLRMHVHANFNPPGKIGQEFEPAGCALQTLPKFAPWLHANLQPSPRKFALKLSTAPHKFACTCSRLLLPTPLHRFACNLATPRSEVCMETFIANISNELKIYLAKARESPKKFFVAACRCRSFF